MIGYTVGQRVRAFHPGRFGVVNEGTIVAVGRKYLRVDFGPMFGGTWRVRFADVVSPMTRASAPRRGAGAHGCYPTQQEGRMGTGGTFGG